MKKFILTLACAMVCGVCSAQITIKLKELKCDTAYLIINDGNLRNILRTDTIVGKKGVFKYDFKEEKAHSARINIKYNKNTSTKSIILVPGEKGTLEGNNLADAVWSGKGFYGDMRILDDASAQYEKETSNLIKDYNAQIKAGANKDSLSNIVMPKYNELNKKIVDAKMDFIKANPKSGASAIAIVGMQNAEPAIGYIDQSLKTGLFSDFINYAQARIDAEKARNEAKKNVVDGALAPDFTLKDINGNDLSLSSLRGKYVILDFWGSWCGWCIKGFPEMKNYYKKYEGKFEILGVDCRDTEDKWKAAVQKHELPWKHVYNPESSSLTIKYAIQGYPTKIVIDPEGKIAKTIIGEDPAFYTYLDDLFGEKQ